jgi:hypothetical protein
MKKIIVAALILFSGCKEPNKTSIQNIPENVLDNNSENYDQQYRIYTFEGCEYIVVDISNRRWGSHKGNCKNHKTK